MNGAQGAPGGLDEGVDGDGLPDLINRPKPFDAASFAPADVAQGLMGDGVPFTVIENTDGRLLTKSFSATADGRSIDAWDAAHNSSSARAIRAGTDADRAHTFASLRDKVRSLKPIQCIITAPLPGTAPTRQVLFKEQWEALPPDKRDPAGDGPVYRGSECFVYPAGQPALLELDIDTKDWPADIQEKHHQAGDLFQAVLPAIDPQFKSAGYYARPSSSAGVRNKMTGKMLPTGAKHVFFVADDGADLRRYCAVLSQRLVLAGYGFIRVFKDGKTEVRSPIDLAASGRPERLWYDAEPVLGQQLELVAKHRQEQVQEGKWLDTRRLEDLNAIEQEDYNRIVAKLEAAAKPEADRVREAYIEVRVERAVAAGIPRDEARRLSFAAVDGGRLDVDGEYRLDDGNWRSGWAILKDVAAINGKTGADPLEPDYGGGNNKALWYRKPGNPGVCCFSQAHGKRVFSLAYDVADWIALVDQATGTLPERLDQLRDAGRHYWPEDHEQAHALLRQAGVPAPVVLDFVDAEEVSRDALLAILRDPKPDRLFWLKCLGRLLRDALAALRDEDEVIGLDLDFAVDWDGLTARLAAAEKAVAPVGVTLTDFHAYMPMHNYIFIPTRELWPASSINARIPPVQIGVNEAGEPVYVKANTWLDQNRPVEQMTWAPGLPEIIEDRLLYEGGWLDRAGVRCFNQYLAPTIIPGEAHRADRWLDHVRLVYPNDAEHIVCWLAHRVQRPHEKINHAIVLGGEQGIGKDMLLEPVKRAIGPWNFQEASPQQVLGRFNGFLKGVILRINEARDLGEFDRFKFYDHMKAYTASPPDTLRVDEKHLREHAILNVCGVIITTNHKTDGIYLPAEDRRHYVAWSDITKEDQRFAGGYWKRIYAYYEDGGAEAVAAYLGQLDISAFDPKAPPPKTPAFWAIVDATRAPEEPELADVLDKLGNPAATTLSRIQSKADGDFADWLRDRRNRRIIPHRMEKCGYVPVRNPDAIDGLWKVSGKRQAIYARKNLGFGDQITAARELASSPAVSVITEVSDQTLRL